MLTALRLNSFRPSRARLETRLRLRALYLWTLRSRLFHCAPSYSFTLSLLIRPLIRLLLHSLHPALRLSSLLYRLLLLNLHPAPNLLRLLLFNLPASAARRSS